MPKPKIKAKDAVQGSRLYIRIQNKWHHVQVVGTKPSPKGLKVLYQMDNGTQGEQLLSAFYTQISDDSI